MEGPNSTMDLPRVLITSSKTEKAKEIASSKCSIQICLLGSL